MRYSMLDAHKVLGIEQQLFGSGNPGLGSQASNLEFFSSPT